MNHGQRNTVINFWHSLLSWANFCLATAAVLKFIPIAISLTHGMQLTSAQIAEGLGEERAWALDLISDTPYLVVVWLAVALWLRWQTGHMLLLPWRSAQESE